jgi:hypothetical protein
MPKSPLRALDGTSPARLAEAQMSLVGAAPSGAVARSMHGFETLQEQATQSKSAAPQP